VINLSTQREKQQAAAVQTRIMLIYERRLNKAMRKEMNRVARESSAAYADSPEHAETALVPVLADHRNRVRALLAKTYEPVMTRFADGIEKAAAKKSIGYFERKDFDYQVEIMINDWMTIHALEQSNLIGTTTGNAVKNILIAGTDAGESSLVIGNAIKKHIGTRGIGAWRAQTIARTETHQAAMASSKTSAEATGLTLLKEWISVDDDRTRMSHSRSAAAGGPDGLIVGMYEPFAFTGGKRRVVLAYPSDPSGPPEETINCRCVMVYEESIR